MKDKIIAIKYTRGQDYDSCWWKGKTRSLDVDLCMDYLGKFFKIPGEMSTIYLVITKRPNKASYSIDTITMYNGDDGSTCGGWFGGYYVRLHHDLAMFFDKHLGKYFHIEYDE